MKATNEAPVERRWNNPYDIPESAGDVMGPRSAVLYLGAAMCNGQGETKVVERGGFVADGTGVQHKAEVVMSQRTFSLIASVVFGLIALGHVLRIVFNMSFVVQDFSVPMSASGLGVVILGYLAYQGFRLARKSPSEV